MSSSLAPRTACFAVHDRSWITELLSAVHAPKLPPILNAGNIVGGVRHGLLRDSGAATGETLLVAGGHDHPIAAAMVRRFDRNGRVDSMGTANLLYGETEAFTDPALLAKLAFSVPPSGTGLACLGVLELNPMLASIRDASSLRAYLSQGRLPGEPPRSIEELRKPSGTGDVRIRRSLEDVSLRARMLFAALDSAGVPRGNIYATGGWSRSKALIELRASVFGQTITALGDLELTAIGAALFGAEAATGRSTCPIQNEDTTVIEPIREWSDIYEEIFSTYNQD